MGRNHRMIRNLLIDAVAAGLALTVFALFHHVLPREKQGLNVQIVNPAAAAEAAETNAEAETQEAAESTEKTEKEAETETEKTTFQPTIMTTASASTGSSKAPGSSAGRGKRKSGGGQNAMNGKGGSALTESETEAAGTEEITGTVSLADKFADKFTDTVVVTADSYSSPDLSITVTEVNEGSLTYYVADIYVRDITCFQTALASDTYGSGFRDSIEEMAALNNALLAVNGDYYGNTSEGVVIRNGVIYRANPTNCDVCVLYYDGTMKVMPGSSFSVEEAVADGAWQAWTFGPALLDTNGETISSFSSTNRIISANPRTAIGYYEPGHYCLVVVDGRGESSGITLPRLSQLFYSLGCTAAYNLDGGNSSIMVWGDEVINNPSGGGRESSDALLIAEVREYE